MRLSHPPSRLSPPPGTSVHDLFAAAGDAAPAGSAQGTPATASGSAGAGPSSGAAGSSAPSPTTPAKRKEDDRTPKRGYRACVHCRLRKAKCDLGDVNAPSEPPCTRCRREQRNCIFLPSKRRRKTPNDDLKPEIYPVAGGSGYSGTLAGFSAAGLSAGASQMPGQLGGQMPGHPHTRPQMPGQVPMPSVDVSEGLGFTQAARTGSGGASSIGVKPGLGGTQAGAGGTHGAHGAHGHMGPGVGAGPPGSGAGAAGSGSGSRVGGSGSGSMAAPGHAPGWSDSLSLFEPKMSPMFDPPTNATSSSHVSGSTASPSNPSTGGSTRRKRLSEPDATRRIVVASFNNETDALEILAKAATDADDEPTDKGEDNGQRGERSKRVAWAEDQPRPLSQFVLIARGIVDERTLEQLVDVFFTHHHPVLPIFQTVRIPHNKTQLAALAHEDPFLVSAIVCVASRHHPDPGMKEVHERTYGLIRETLADYACAGLQPSIGFVEGVLILAENLPRDKLSTTAADMTGPASSHSEVHGLHGVENRRSWALTGTAIRAAYGLGLDQLALEDGERDAELERARGVWTWCYLFDRTLGLRTGLAFWSRGPALCFQGISDISQTGEAAARLNFPYMMQPAAGGDDMSTAASSPSSLVDANDSASMMQAYMELTQIMTNAHDILFSTPSRTSALVRKGEYFKFLDHFRRALESFCVAWKDKVWRLDAVRELTWCTYHFVRLYVAAFAFQAHVQRAQERAEQEKEAREREGKLATPGMPAAGAVSIFPRGSATSPDAVYIYESIDAAHEILGICLRLGHRGVLRYLPTRYLTNFAYSGTFALKAAYSGAVAKTDISKTTELVERVCAALLLASPDKDHPACRFGTMLRLLTRRLTELSDQSAVPSRFPSPERAATPDVQLPVHIDMLHVPNVQNDLEVPSVNAGAASAPGSTTGAAGAPATATPGMDGLFDLGQVPPALFDVDLDVGFNLDGFWEDFTLTDSGGFPFR